MATTENSTAAFSLAGGRAPLRRFTPDAAQAMEFASRCWKPADKVTAEIDEILLQDSD